MGREIDGKLRVANDSWGDFRFSVATGKIAGLNQRTVYGNNPDINGSLEDVWQVGGMMSYPASPTTLRIFSAEVEDDAAGNGVQVIRVEYLDGDFETNFVDVEMDGTSKVQVATDFFRLQNAYAISVGANGDAEGAITLEYGASNVAIGTFIAGTNELRGSHYTVPAGYTAYLTGASVSASKGGDVTFQFELRDSSVAGAPFITGDELSIFEEGIYFDIPTYYVIPEKYDIRIRAVSGQGSNIAVSATYHLILRNNRIYANN